MKFAKRVYLIAAIYGLIVLVPQYFMEGKNGRDFPPAITHAEYYYGFIGVAVAWQFAFLVIASDPVRYRPLMIPSIVEKASFGVPAMFLYAQGRLHQQMLGAGILDMILGVLFVTAYVRTPSGSMLTDPGRRETARGNT
jgi:hypothetical protein